MKLRWWSHWLCDWQDQLCGRDLMQTDDVMAVLNEFTQLSKMENSKVALCARQVSRRVMTLWPVMHVSTVLTDRSGLSVRLLVRSNMAYSVEVWSVLCNSVHVLVQVYFCQYVLHSKVCSGRWPDMTLCVCVKWFSCKEEWFFIPRP